MTDVNVIEVNDENFESIVVNSKIPVVVDFWAPWCGPCRMMGPVFAEAAEEMKNLKFCKLNVDDSNEIAGKFRVTSIPFFAILKAGKVIATKSGSSPKANLIEWITVNAK